MLKKFFKASHLLGGQDVLIVGFFVSQVEPGGLSHEPPVPTLAHPDAAVRERITVKREPTAAERDAKTERVKAAGMALAAGDASMKPLNPEWDRRWMDALASGGLHALTGISEASIEHDAGLSAHESKSWLIARAALPAHAALPCPLRYYRAIPELIAGYGSLTSLGTADVGQRAIVLVPSDSRQPIFDVLWTTD